MNYKKFKLLSRLYKRNDPYVIPADECNTNCFYCSDKYSPSSLKSNILDQPISEKMFKKLIKFMDPKISSLKMGEGYLNGGQFTSHPSWKKLLSILREKYPKANFRMRMGDVPTKEELSYLAQKTEELTLSLHTLDTEVLDQIKNNRIQSIKENLKLTAELGIKIRIFYLVIPAYTDWEDIEKNLRFLEQLPNISLISFAPPSYTKNTPDIYKEKLQIDEKKLLQKARELNKKFNQKIDVNYLFLSHIPEDLHMKFYKKLKSDVTSRTDREDKILLLPSEKMYPIAQKLCSDLNSRFDADLHAIKITNHFYGGNVKVGGLLTAKDFLRKKEEINAVNADVILTTDVPFDCDGYDIQGGHKIKLENSFNAPILFI